MLSSFRAIGIAVALLAAAFASPAWAGVVVGQTRVIYPAGQDDVTVALANHGQAPVLVQVWLDEGDPQTRPEDTRAPFMPSPSVVRMDPDQKLRLRLVYTQEPLPQDRESLFWLNVLDVPAQSEAANRLQFAFRTRIKLFFRPQKLPGQADAAPGQVRWTLLPAADGGSGYALKAVNPSAYYVNLDTVSLDVDGRAHAVDASHIEPGGELLFPLEDLTSPPSGAAGVRYAYIDDWGAVHERRAPLE